MRRILSWRSFSERSELSVSTLKRLRNSDPNFPRKIQISPGRVGFFEHEVDRWLDSLDEQHNQPVRLGEVTQQIVDRLANERRRL